MDKACFWSAVDNVKRRLFSVIRIEYSKIDFLKGDTILSKVKAIPDRLLAEWNILQDYYTHEFNEHELNRLKGFLYEALFYCACLESQLIFLMNDILKLAGETDDDISPLVFECVPLYDIIPNLLILREEGKKRERKAPQIKADFIVRYVDKGGPTLPVFVEVKSSEEAMYRSNKEALLWSVIAARRLVYGFQIAFPSPHCCDNPRTLRDWSYRSICLKCNEFTTQYDICEYCGSPLIENSVTEQKP